ncbi:hypothetical protein P9112_004370 [Eukaryota sp. TZLM1-RC]
MRSKQLSFQEKIQFLTVTRKIVANSVSHIFTRVQIELNLCFCDLVEKSTSRNEHYCKVDDENITLYHHYSEKELLSSFKLSEAYNPLIICGFNIFKFDIPNIMKRSENEEFLKGEIDASEWVQYYNSNLIELNHKHLNPLIAGRFVVDTCSIYTNYCQPRKLDTVSKILLGESKIDLDPQYMAEYWKVEEDDPFSDFSLFQRRTAVAVHCLRDTDLTMKLFNFL